MIIVKLKGGLGNQLFQYVAGRAVSIRENAIYKLDASGYDLTNSIDTPRKYALSTFNIKAEIATKKEIEKIKNPYGIFTKGLRFFKMKVLHLFNMYYKRGENLYMDGFFQSEKYFADIREVVKKDLSLSVQLGNEASLSSNLIRNTKNSVSLHVRRGDYVQNTRTNKYHGTCDSSYYTRALEYINEKIGAGSNNNSSSSLHIFVFSDDIEWVRANMPIKFPATYVSNPNIKDYEELILMSQCNHHIIANSSFSWWGAWLGQNPQKIVIAPKRWVRKGEYRFKDITPPDWIRL